MSDRKNSEKLRIDPGSMGIIAILFGIFFISSCAHPGDPLTSFSPEISASSNGHYFPAPLTIADATPDDVSGDAAEDSAEAVDASEEDAFEEDPFEEDPFEEDPFEEDPFEDDPFEDAGSDAQQIEDIADPLEGLNRVFFHVNDKLYYWVLKPVARGYRVVVPNKIRIGLSNFFTNLLGPLRFVNCLLQGRGDDADAELVRFVMNSTVGVLGFGDPAKNYPRLVLHDEDFGQTFGRWGIGHGIYIVLPVLGPSTLRDSAGLVCDFMLEPVGYVEPVEAALGIWALDNINGTSFRIGDYESLRDAALDPYEAFRNAYIQHSRKAVAK